MRTFGAFIDWLLRNFLRLAIIGVIIFAVLSFGLQTCEGDTGKPPAKVDDTRFQITTDSRIFYVDNFQQEGRDIIISNFWVKEGKRWNYYERTLRLTEAYGKREVIRR